MRLFPALIKALEKKLIAKVLLQHIYMSPNAGSWCILYRWRQQRLLHSSATSSKGTKEELAITSSLCTDQSLYETLQEKGQAYGQAQSKSWY